MKFSGNKHLRLLATVLCIAICTVFLKADMFLKLVEEKLAIEVTALKSSVGGASTYRAVERRFWELVKGTGQVVKPGSSLAPTPVAVNPALGSAGPSLSFDNAVLLLGSSAVRLELGVRIERDLKKLGFTKIVRYGKISSGLTDSKVLDWEAKARDLIRQQNPTAIVCHFGANDGQAIIDQSGKKILFDDPAWSAVYTAHVERFMALISQSSRVYWIELPIASDQRFREKFIKINAIQKRVAAKHPNIRYIPTWDTFAPNGTFAPVLPDANGVVAAVKAADGVHFTDHGAKIVSALLLPHIQEDMNQN